MTKSELIAELSAANPHLLSRDVETIVATIFNEITAALSRGERVELRGFGAFTVKQRDRQTGVFGFDFLQQIQARAARHADVAHQNLRGLRRRWHLPAQR